MIRVNNDEISWVKDLFVKSLIDSDKFKIFLFIYEKFGHLITADDLEYIFSYFHENNIRNSTVYLYNLLISDVTKAIYLMLR